MNFAKLRKMSRLLKNCLFRRGLRYGVAAAIEHETPLSRIQPVTVLDVGANKGQFSLLCRSLYPSAEIIAFEPLEEPAVKFDRVFAGDARTRLIRSAVGPTAESRKMFVSRRQDSSSLLPITQHQVAVFPGTELDSVCEVATAPLDDLVAPDLLSRPVLLKLDIQGYELEALRSAERILDVTEFVYLEMSFLELYGGQCLADDVIRYLQGKNFVLSAVSNAISRNDVGVVQMDVLFVKGRHFGLDEASVRLRGAGI